MNDIEEKISVEEREIKEFKELPKKNVVGFGCGSLTDQMSHQYFQVLVFTFFYSVIGIDVGIIGISFVIFAIWDSVNDPLLGPISDRTNTRFGRRGFWILISLFPFALINFLLFTPPGLESNEIMNSIYMVLIIMAYDLFYTMFSGNQTALFQEMFKSEKARSYAATYKNLLTIVGVLLGFVLPTILIDPLAPSVSEGVTAESLIPKYQLTGVIMMILVIIFGGLFYKYGVVEDPADITKPETMPSLIESLKQTLKNKTFIIFVTANLFIWFVFKLLTTIVPLYGQFVLGNGKGNFMITLLLLAAFLTAAACFPLMQKLGNKYGMRETLMLACIVWIIGVIPFWFFDGQKSNIPALIFMIVNGFGLSGAMYFVDIIIGNIIDEDEIKNGKRREGSYYGINALINRYSTILVFVSISAVLTGYGWENFLADAGELELENLKTGLRVLFTVFTGLGLLVVLILLKIFPLHGKKLENVKEKIKAKKREQFGETS